MILIAAAGLGFLVTFPESLFNRHSDLISQHLASQTVLYDSWQSDRKLPLWRDDQLSGSPAFTNPQTAYSHPLHALFAVFPPARVVGLVIWLQLVFAAIGAYMAAATLKLSLPGRVLTAIGTLFSFKTILAVYAGWLPVIAAVAAVPFVFATGLLVLERPSLASALGLGLAGTVALHAGHPQVTYYTALLVGLWGVAHLVRTGQANVAAAARVFTALLSGAALAVGLSAYRLLPIAADLPLVTRSDATGEFVFGGASLVPAALLTLIRPEYWGTPLDDSYAEGWEYILYLGVVPTALAVFGFAFGGRRPHVTALRVGVLLSIALAIDSPLLWLVTEVVPGYGLFRMPARVLFLTAFFAYCLAGVGTDELIARLPDRTRSVVIILLVAAVTVEGSYWARRYLRAPDPAPFPVAAPYVDALRTSEPGRIAPLSTSTPSYGSASPLGLQLVTGYDPFIFRHYQSYLDLVQVGRVVGARSTVWANLDGIVRWDMLDALNVAFVVSPAPLPDVPSSYAPAQVFSEQPQFRFYEGIVRGPVYVYRNERPLQRAFFVPSVRTVSSEDQMLAAVLRGNLREEAVVLGGSGGTSHADPVDRVDLQRGAGGAIELTAVNAHRRFLVISEVWHPGWQVTVNGEPAILHRANIALQGLWLEPGVHHIRLRFWPVGLSAGLIVTATAVGVLLICAGLLVLRRVRRSP